MARYNIYTDGSLMSQGERFMGGWAFIVVDNRKDEVIYDSYGKLQSLSESCIKPELEAIYQALCWAKDNLTGSIHIMSDSEVIVGSINGECRRNTNRQYWDIIEPLCKTLMGRLNISHIKSHIREDCRGRHHNYNSMCDRLAKKGANSLLIEAIKER